MRSIQYCSRKASSYLARTTRRAASGGDVQLGGRVATANVVSDGHQGRRFIEMIASRNAISHEPLVIAMQPYKSREAYMSPHEKLQLTMPYGTTVRGRLPTGAALRCRAIDFECGG